MNTKIIIPFFFALALLVTAHAGIPDLFPYYDDGETTLDGNTTCASNGLGITNCGWNRGDSLAYEDSKSYEGTYSIRGAYSGNVEAFGSPLNGGYNATTYTIHAKFLMDSNNPSRHGIGYRLGSGSKVWLGVDNHISGNFAIADNGEYIDTGVTLTLDTWHDLWLQYTPSTGATRYKINNGSVQTFTAYTGTLQFIGVYQTYGSSNVAHHDDFYLDNFYIYNDTIENDPHPITPDTPTIIAPEGKTYQIGQPANLLFEPVFGLNYTYYLQYPNGTNETLYSNKPFSLDGTEIGSFATGTTGNNDGLAVAKERIYYGKTNIKARYKLNGTLIGDVSLEDPQQLDYDYLLGRIYARDQVFDETTYTLLDTLTNGCFDSGGVSITNSWLYCTDLTPRLIIRYNRTSMVKDTGYTGHALGFTQVQDRYDIADVGSTQYIVREFNTTYIQLIKYNGTSTVLQSAPHRGSFYSGVGLAVDEYNLAIYDNYDGIGVTKYWDYASPSFHYDTTNLPAGTYKLGIQASNPDYDLTSDIVFSTFTVVPPPMTAIADLAVPATNTFHNTNINFNFSLSEVYGTATCTLYKGTQPNVTTTGLTDGTHTITYNAGTTDSYTSQFHINCDDGITNTNTTSVTLRVDLVDPAIMSYTPLIDNTTTIDTQIQLNISVYNDYLNNSHINITGQGDNAYYSSTAGTPTHTYTQTINTTTWTEGTKNIEVYGDDQLQTNTANFAFTICHPVWVCNAYDTCNTQDESPCTSVQDTNCGYDQNDYTINYTAYTPNTCNYCTSTYTTTTTECFLHEQNVTSTYTNNCCVTTGLPTDCNIPTNQTGVECSPFTYDANDIAPAFIDGIAKIFILTVSFATIIGITILLSWTIRKAKKPQKK